MKSVASDQMANLTEPQIAAACTEKAIPKTGPNVGPQCLIRLCISNTSSFSIVRRQSCIVQKYPPLAATCAASLSSAGMSAKNCFNLTCNKSHPS